MSGIQYRAKSTLENMVEIRKVWRPKKENYKKTSRARIERNEV